MESNIVFIISLYLLPGYPPRPLGAPQVGVIQIRPRCTAVSYNTGMPTHEPDPALEKRHAVETAIGGLGKALLVFLTAGILILLALFGRQLFGILTGG